MSRTDEYSEGYLHPGAVLHPFAPDGQFAISMADWGYEAPAGGHVNSAPHFYVPHYTHVHPAEMQVPLQRGKLYSNGVSLEGIVVPLLAGLRVVEDSESTTRRVIEVGFLEGMQMLKTLQMAENHFINSGPRAQFPFVKSIPMLSTMQAQMLPFSLPVQSFNPGFSSLQAQMMQPQLLQPLQSSMQQPIHIKTISHPDLQLMQMQELQAFNAVQQLPQQQQQQQLQQQQLQQQQLQQQQLQQLQQQQLQQQQQQQQMHAPREGKHKSQTHQQHNGSGSASANGSQLKDMYAPVCLDFVKGVCSQKRACCKFAHPPQMNLVAGLVSPNPSGEGRSVCALWMLTGTCKFGDRCRDLHVPINEQPSGEPSDGNRKSSIAPIPHAPVTT